MVVPVFEEVDELRVTGQTCNIVDKRRFRTSSFEICAINRSV